MSNPLRTDAHRPSALDPKDYIWVGYTDECWDYDAEVDHGHFQHYESWLDGFDPVAESHRMNLRHPGGCDSCGANPLRYRGWYLHSATGEVIVLGTDCAKKMEFDCQASLLAAKDKIRQEESARLKAKVAAWIAESPENTEAAEFMDTVYEAKVQHDFVLDVRSKLYQYGSLSERQVAAILRVKNTPVREPEVIVPIPDELFDGRVQITGEIVSSKWKQTQFGDTLKMVVVDERGFKVWGTQPECLQVEDKEGDYTRPAGKGDKITFMAKLDRSNDVNFAFFKRPTKAEVLS